MIIIQDTREQNPWSFDFFDGFSTKVKKLDTGDYSIEGYEEILTIDRKASSSELATNIGKNGKRFDAEMKRMESFKHKFLLCEFTLENLLEFPKNSGIPKSQLEQFKIRISPAYMIKKLNEYANEYGVEVIFCDSRDDAIDMAMSIFQEVYNG